MTRKQHAKAWHDRHSKKLQNKKKKCKKHSTKSSAINTQSTTKQYATINKSTNIVPENFSFLENTANTIDFFSNISSELLQKIYNKHFFIDSKNVTNVTVDSLIYQIAIMQNMRVNYQMRYTFRGNLPDDTNASLVYKESGFMSYVQSKEKKLPQSTNKMQIISGKRNDSTLASKLCSFVMEKLKKKLSEIQSLQKVLIELMSNVYHHAYNNNELMNNNWYIYAEYIENYVRFVFVDTGAGIAQTVRKNPLEKIQRFIKISSSDSDLICSTLLGDFRTETKESHRGNGLSGVYNLATTNLFRNFTVISGYGKCVVAENETIIKKEYKNKIYGTMYIFDII